MRGVLRVARLLVRRHRLALIAWILGLLALASITIPSYEEIYGGEGSREVLVGALESNAAMRLLYGPLQGSSLGELFVWETGSYLIILACIMTLLLGISLTRGEEDAGTVELLRSTGIQPRAILVSAVVVLTGASFLVGGGTATILVAQAAVYDELTVAGGLLFGSVLALAALCVGLLTVLAAQLRRPARSARGLAFTALALLFGVRVLADERGWAWLRWLTPLGWRDLVLPYSENNAWVGAVLAGVVIAVGIAVVVIARRREVGSALWERSAGSRTRLRLGGFATLGVPGVWSWAWIAARGSVVGWLVAVVALAALFGSMTGSMVTLIEDDPATREIMAQITAEEAASVPAMFFEFLASFLAVLVLIAAVTLTLRWRAEEASGRLVQELGTGVPRRRSLTARVMVAVLAAALVAATSGVVLGAVGRWQLENEGSALFTDAVQQAMPWSISGMVGQIPGVLAAVGVTALVIAIAPRLTAVVWAVVAYSGTVAYFGDLLSLPAWARNLGLLSHAPPAGRHGWPQWSEWFVGWPLSLAILGILGVTLAILLLPRRDLSLA